MVSQNETIRIVVCGDEGVGKSSLITSLVKDIFVPDLQSVLPPITIPRELTSLTLTSDSYTGQTVIVDTSSLLSERATLTKEIRRANVIWLVYSDHYTCERITLFWMPFFRSLGVNLPVVVCANKCDLAPREDHSRAIADELVPIIQEFKEIESCIRSSAKNHFNVNQTFYLCQRAVTHPLAPLFDSKEGKLKHACVATLERIFFLADTDQDGYLSDEELLALQKKCFPGRPLDSVDVDQIKSVLREIDEAQARADSDMQTLANRGTIASSGGGISNENRNRSNTTTTTTAVHMPLVSHKGVSSAGFIALNKTYAEKGRHETTWGILRAFHYTDSLSLEDQYLCPKIDVPKGSSVELSPSGYRFLVDLFVLFDKDNDGGLNQEELAALFKPTPELPKLWQQTAFPTSTVRNEAGNVTLQGWLAQWSMTTYLDYKTTVTYLALLGFDSRIDESQPRRKLTEVVRVTKPRKRKRLGHSSSATSTMTGPSLNKSSVTDRNVFNCFVLGSSGSGKSSLLNAFLGRQFTPLHVPTIKPVTVVNSVEMPGGKQCYMILEELGEQEPAILANPAALDECDVLCYTYDSADPDSFAYLVELRKKYPHLDTLPAVYAALKADLDRQQQRGDVQPDVYTRNLSMTAPLHVSVEWPSSLNELFVQLAEAAQHPATATPREGPEEDISLILPLVAATAVASILVATYWFRRAPGGR